MEIIDTVDASNVEAGDSIEFFDEDGESLGIQEVANNTETDDSADWHTLTSEQGDTMDVLWDTQVNIYGYTDED